MREGFIVTDITSAGRALFAVAGSALAVGAAVSPALADGLDGQHLSVNQGAGCAVHDVGETGRHVLSTGALPKVFNHVNAGSGTDGVKALCDAVDRTPAARPEGAHQPQGLLGGLPVGR